MNIDLRSLPTKNAYKLMTGSIIPRPIAWVSTEDAIGNRNLAPFSFFTVASRNPPMVCISIGPGVGERDGTIKDTLENIRSREEFVINIVSSDLGNEMQLSSNNYGSNIDEFKVTGLTPINSKVVKPARVKEAPIAFEIQLYRIIELGSDHLIVGNVVNYYIDEDYYLGNYKVNMEKLKPLGRLAGNYGEINNFFRLPTGATLHK